MPYTKRTTGFKRKRTYGRKSTRKPKRYGTRRPKRVIRRATRSRAVARIPRLVSDLQYGRKRPNVFKTTYCDMRTYRVTPRHTTVGTGTPATMFVRLADIGGDIFHATAGIWKPLHFSSEPALFERMGKFYDGYKVLGAKVTVTIKPCLGNTTAHDGHNFVGGEPKINDEGIILATVGNTDHPQWPSSATTPDDLTKYPNSRSHTSIYKRQEAQIAAGSQLDQNGNELNPNYGKAIAMVPGERGKQLSFTTKYSPRKLYGQPAGTNGYLLAPLEETNIGHANSAHQQYAFIDIREFECAPLNAVVQAGDRDWTMTPDCFVTIRVNYIIQVSDPRGVGGTLLDSRTQIINSAEVAETDAPLQDGGGGDMDVPVP
jgi:hypothetical protein